MRLSWNEIRVRAATFAKDWAGEGYEKGQTQLFYRDFFDVFGVPVRRVAAFEEPVKNLGDKRGFIDLFWKGVVLVEQKSIGRDLKKAKKQALDYFPGLKDAELPRFVLLSNFQTFELYDLEEDDEITFDLADLPKHVEKFGFFIGVQKRTFKDQDPVNIEASELVGKLHDALELSGYIGHDLEQFLVRIVFCLFADDTGIFEPRDIFLDLLENRTGEDGSDLGGWITQLFQVLNTQEEKRSKNLDEDLDRFPWVNGDLFKDTLQIPSFDGKMRECLIDASRFDWSGISPAIFGSLFQSVMEKVERRAKGAHYTTEKNILKVIEPLFMDDLWAEFKRLKSRKDSRRRPELLKFQEKLGTLNFFDPACGCGNFLVITYRELRQLEMEVLKEIYTSGQLDALAETLSVIDVDQFYGIEIGEFPSRIAETALWMMDHIMNNRLSLEFGLTYVRIPLMKSPHIHVGDALEIDWKNVISSVDCSFILGNPPFLGKKEQSPYQKSQLRRVFKNIKGCGNLDYVSCWFQLASIYSGSNPEIEIGFVSTKSITQGEQVSVLWGKVLSYGMVINFAHRTFEWQSEARGSAHVHVVIIGFSRSNRPRKRLFDYPDIKNEPNEITASKINPYLVDGVNVLVKKESEPISPRPKISKGSEATDFGFLTLSKDEMEEIVSSQNFNQDWIREFIGGDEYINGEKRYCLWLEDANPGEIRGCPSVVERIDNVAKKRSESTKVRTIEYAKFPTIFGENRQPSSEYILIPKVSSQRRQYIPMGFVSCDIIVSGSAQFIETSEKWVLGIIISEMHMGWMRAVGGRTKSDYQYSNTLIYNSYPWPNLIEKQKQDINKLVQSLLDARASHFGVTLADLYDPNLMPVDLRKAHKALDRAVDKLYRRSGFSSDRERVEHLLGLYEEMVDPLTAAAKPKKTRRKKKSAKKKSGGAKKVSS